MISETKDALRRALDFKSKTGRADYWKFSLVFLIATCAGAVISAMLPMTAILLFPAHLWLGIAHSSAFVRRIRDANGRIRLAISFYTSLAVFPAIAIGGFSLYVWRELQDNSRAFAPKTAEHASLGIFPQMGPPNLLEVVMMSGLVIPAVLFVVANFVTLKPSKAD